MTPDVADVSLVGNYLVFSLHVPNHVSGDPHASTGSTPGLAVINVTKQLLNDVIHKDVPNHNVSADGIERVNTHAIRVQLK